MRQLVAVLALALSISMACGSVPSAPAASSPSGTPAMNVLGTLDRGTAQPCPPGDPCDPAIVGAFLVFSQPGKPDIRTSVSGGGDFALQLSPGYYTITAAPSPANGRLQPGDVRVPSTGTIELHLVLLRTPA
jgi:hypothetical protein